jgi:hypothetical protein
MKKLIKSAEVYFAELPGPDYLEGGSPERPILAEHGFAILYHLLAKKRNAVCVASKFFKKLLSHSDRCPNVHVVSNRP